MLVYIDKTLGIIERLSATHRVGRVLPSVADVATPSILVFAAHPDDDVLGVGITMHRHVLSGNRVRVIFTSNGGGHSRLRRHLLRDAMIRYREACAALAHVGVMNQDVGCLGLPDGRLYRYMKQMARDIKWLIERIEPKRIYVHSIEGGHRDHDITGFVVQSVCKQISYSDVYEWSEYNSLQTLRDDPIDFPPYAQEIAFEPERLVFTAEERALKQSMLLAHSSQVTPMRLTEYKGESELFRRCRLENLEAKLVEFWKYSIRISRINSLTEDFEFWLNGL